MVAQQGVKGIHGGNNQPTIRFTHYSCHLLPTREYGSLDEEQNCALYPHLLCLDPDLIVGNKTKTVLKFWTANTKSLRFVRGSILGTLF
jgi:hypothetical protein